MTRQTKRITRVYDSMQNTNPLKLLYRPECSVKKLERKILKKSRYLLKHNSLTVENIFSEKHIERLKPKQKKLLAKAINKILENAQKPLGEFSPHEQVLFQHIIDVFRNPKALKYLSCLPDLTPYTEIDAGIKFKRQTPS